MRHILLATALCLAGGAAAHAEPVTDAGSGLAVDPPAGYRAELAPGGAGQQARIIIRQATDKRDTGCMAGFSGAKSQPDMTQAELNKAARELDMGQIATQAIGAIYDVRSTAPFEHAGVYGLMMVADIKQLPNIPPRSQEVRSMMVMLDTPKGRTTIVCVGEKTEFEQRLAEYQQVARSVSPPG